MDKAIIYFGEQRIPCSDNIIFYELKHLILKSQGKLVRQFKYDIKKINERLLVRNFSSFLYEVDPNIFVEFTKDKYRCRKYLKMEKYRCSHTERCKSLYKFKKIDYTKIIEGKYEEDDMISINRIFDRIDEKRRQYEEKEKKKMIQEINDILNSP